MNFRFSLSFCFVVPICLIICIIIGINCMYLRKLTSLETIGYIYNFLFPFIFTRISAGRTSSTPSQTFFNITRCPRFLQRINVS